MTTNGATEMQITNEHLQELFRRMPAAAEVMRFILLEAENNRLKQRLGALEAASGPDVTTAPGTSSPGTTEFSTAP